MAVSKVILNGNTLMDATTATAAAGDITAPKTAMLADGVVTTGTGTAPTRTKQISITQNGTTTEDVTNYASAEITVNVQGGGEISFRDLALKTVITGDVVLDLSGNEYLSGTAFQETRITSISAPTLKRASGNNHFRNCTALKTAYLPMLQETSTIHFSGPFSGCTALETITMPYTRLSAFMFDGCRSLKVFVNKRTDNAVQGIQASTFRDCSSLEILDFSYLTQAAATWAFDGCTALETLILRRSDAIVPCSAAGALPPVFRSGGTGGTIYIPKALYDELGTGSSLDYKAATNWSTVDGYGTITWAQIDGSIYETQYADGTPIT